MERERERVRERDREKEIERNRLLLGSQLIFLSSEAHQGMQKKMTK